MKRSNRTQWHNGFYSVMVLRLKDVRDKVEIIREHALTTKPMMIDLMIIKKDPTAVIDDVIAHGWRTFNILEYENSKYRIFQI